MDRQTSTPSRRSLLGALSLTPSLALIPAIRSPLNEALALLHHSYEDPPATLARTRAGRDLSRERYRRARAFLPDEEPASALSWRDFLYRAGISAQLGLAAHLLDVGFADAWCADHIGLRVAKSLAYANATGLGHADPDMARLAGVLTPYWKWNRPYFGSEAPPSDGGFSPSQVIMLLGDLLDHIGHVTGHAATRSRGLSRG